MNTKNYPSLTRTVSALVILALLISGNLTFAQEQKPAELNEFFNLVEQETEPITTGVSRPTLMKDVPASITVVTADEIKLLGLRNLTDVIDFIVPGGIGGIHRSSRTGLYAFRGITVDNNGKYVFMVDGINCGDLTLFGGFNERFIGLMDDLDRIEIIQGTGSILYGSGAISGIINFITKTGQDFQGREITAGYGSWDKYETSFKLGQQVSPDNDSFYYAGFKNSHGTRPTDGTAAESGKPRQRRTRRLRKKLGPHRQIRQVPGEHSQGRLDDKGKIRSGTLRGTFHKNRHNA